MSLAHYSRARFIANLLPLIQRATGLRRVVSVFAGTKEGQVHTDDYQGSKLSILSARGHTATLITLTMAHFAEQAPTVSFVHDFPGHVQSGIGRGFKGVLGALSKVYDAIGPLFSTPPDEVSERHLFYATSDKYPALSQSKGTAVPLPEGISVAKGIYGKPGSGVYTVDNKGEECGAAVVALLDGLRAKGVAEEIWADVARTFIRITGVEAI